MGKHGPCYHCGVTSTPLWRNGPPDKPVLCNACGSRWRTKGSLTNYTPLHARAPIESLEEFKFSKEKSVTFKNKEQKLHKVTESDDHLHGKRDMIDCDQNFHRVYDEDISNRSSSGSAVSYSESCAHFGNADVSDATGSLQSNVWESLIPSKKRTGVTRPKPSSVEKLTKELHFILHQQSSHLSGISEEELLYENSTPNGSVEICNGGVLIRQPNLSTLEEESEASSLLVENKSINSELPLPVHVRSQGPSFSYDSKEKLSKTSAENELGKRDRSQDNFHMLQKRDSQLGFVDLNEVVNLEGFMNYFTDEEQQNLLNLLPSSDIANVPESLRSMFTSTQFLDTLTCFQMLLQRGIFDLSIPGASDNECRSLKMHVLLDLTKHKWVEYSKSLKDTIHERNGGEQNVAGGGDLGCSSNLASVKRPRDHVDDQNRNFQGMKIMIKNPRKICKTGAVGPTSMKSPKPEPTEVQTKSTNVTNEHADSDGSCFSPRSFFAYNSDRCSMLDSMHFNSGKPDQELLLDIRSNSSFPEAELLSDIWQVKDVPNSSVESVASEREDGLSCYPSSSSSSKQPPGIIHA